MMGVRPQVFQTVLLTAGPFGYIINGTLHAGIVMPEETEHTSFGPNIAFSGGVVDFASVTVPGSVARTIDFDTFVP